MLVKHNSWLHDYQKVAIESEIPRLEINNTTIERVAECSVLLLMINEFMNRGLHFFQYR